MTNYSPSTFTTSLMGACEPSVTLENSTASLVGINYDKGSSYRFGSQDAPDWIRLASSPKNMTPFCESGTDITSKHAFYDWGNLSFPESTAQKEIFSSISKEIETISKTGSLLTVLGGDHLITFPVLRGLIKNHQDSFGLIYYDAHTDFYSPTDNRYSHADTLHNIISKEIVDPEKIILIGERSSPPEHTAILNGKGSLVITTAEFESMSIDKISEQIHSRLNDCKNIYVSLDMDVFDPAYAPAVGNPEPAGISPRKFLASLNVLEELSVRAIDIVEIIPSLDTTMITAALAVKILKELLGTISPSCGTK